MQFFSYHTYTHAHTHTRAHICVCMQKHTQVDYTVNGWLKKNVDPLNESVVELFKKSTEAFIAGLWSDYTMEGEHVLLTIIYLAN